MFPLLTFYPKEFLLIYESTYSLRYTIFGRSALIVDCDKFHSPTNALHIEILFEIIFSKHIYLEVLTMVVFFSSVHFKAGLHVI